MPKATQVRDLDKPRTHKFRKEIVTEGKFKTYDKASGKYTLKTISKTDLDKAVSTFNTMKAKGLKVPAPWKHDFNITAFSKFEEGNEGLLEDSTKNAGFWDSLEVTQREDGKYALVGEIEAPGDPKNPDTPAGKIGTSVKDTSIYMRRGLELTDGSGEVLENALMHIALVTHPIEPNQKNFEEIPNRNDSYIAMSQMVGAGDLGELGKLLAEVAGVYLPASTTYETLPDNLSIALEQLKLIKKSEDSDSNISDNKKVDLEPLVMSKLSPEAIQAVVKAGVVNPETGKPYIEAELQGELPQGVAAPQKDPKDALIMSAMQATMQDERRRGFRSRINSLVETGRTSKEHADQNLYPLADNYTIEFNETGVKTPEIETIIMSLEAAPAPRSQASPEYNLGELESVSYQEANELTADQMDKVAMALINDSAIDL